MLIFISGMPGSGKSTIAAMLAKKLGWIFVEADTFLTEDMRRDIQLGIPVTFKQLDQWVLKGVIAHIKKIKIKENIVVSGMLENVKYRTSLMKCRPDTVYVNLKVPYSVLKERVKRRKHFAGVASLNLCWKLRDRYKLLGITVDGSKRKREVIEQILHKIKI